MKCPNPKCGCKKFLPADANFCPECGTQLRPDKVVFISDSTSRIVQKSFLFGGKGRTSTVKGRIVVDIRQCVRTKGVGWTGEYHFTGNSPEEYDGFYAVFDEGAYIQILITNNQLCVLFLMAGNYTLKIWRDRSIYCGYYNKDNVLLKNNTVEFDEASVCISPVLDQLFETYGEECYDFFGITVQELLDGMEDCTE